MTHEVDWKKQADLWSLKVKYGPLEAADSYIYPVIGHIFHLSLVTKQIPCWETRYIMPLHKSDNTTQPDNYTPISVLSNLEISPQLSISVSNRI